MNKILNILIIENTDERGLSIVHQLEGAGYEVTFLRIDNFKTLKIALKEHTFDIIFCNYLMATLNRKSVLRYVQKNVPHTPLLFTSQKFDRIIVDQLLKSNAPLSLEQLTRLAYHDPLTGLANRTLLENSINQALLFARRRNVSIAIFFLDLDRFKLVNDTLGHETGDALLRAVAKRLKRCIRKNDFIGRLGGDEFIFILTDITRIEAVANVAQKVLDAFIPPFVIKGQEIFITTSVGISLYPNDGEDGRTLLQNADIAMYRAKEQGRNNFQFCTAELTAKTQTRVLLEKQLRHALTSEEFFMLYQAKVSANTPEVAGFEALLRWKHPQRGVLTPNDFISLAEDTGLIVPLGSWVLHSVCRQNKAWHEAGFSNIRTSVSVNLSTRELIDTAFAQNIERALQDTHLDPRFLEVEIKESLLFREFQTAAARLKALKSMGVQIALDNYGTGYSSFAHLKELSIDRIKIDLSFIQNIENDGNYSSIIKAMIAMAHNLGIKVTATGVQTMAQWDFLSAHDCDEVQGFIISKPIPPEEVASFLKNWHHPKK